MIPKWQGLSTWAQPCLEIILNFSSPSANKFLLKTVWLIFLSFGTATVLTNVSTVAWLSLAQNLGIKE